MFFRSDSITMSYKYISGMFNCNHFYSINKQHFILLPSILFLTCIDYLNRNKSLFVGFKHSTFFNLILSYLIFISFLKNSDVNFLYFQF